MVSVLWSIRAHNILWNDWQKFPDIVVRCSWTFSSYFTTHIHACARVPLLFPSVIISRDLQPFYNICTHTSSYTIPSAFVTGNVLESASYTYLVILPQFLQPPMRISALFRIVHPCLAKHKSHVSSFFIWHTWHLICVSVFLFLVFFVLFSFAHTQRGGPSSSVSIATRYGLDGPGIASRPGARFSAPVQIGPVANPGSYTIGTGSLPRVKRPVRDVDHPPHLMPRLKKEYS